MYPILLRIGPVTLHTYGALLAVGFFLGFFYMVKLGAKQAISQDAITDMAWVLLLAGLAGARLLYVAFNWPYFHNAPLEILKIWQGGLVWYGGLIAATVAGAIWVRPRGITFWTGADIVAPALALAHGVGRLGCFAAGCCYGRPAMRPWAVTFTNSETLAPPNVPLHPSQLYESALDFALFGALAWLIRRNPRLVGSGRPAMIYLAGYAVVRLFVEFTRGDERGPVFAALTSTQWIAVATLLVAVRAWATLSREREAIDAR